LTPQLIFRRRAARIIIPVLALALFGVLAPAQATVPTPAISNPPAGLRGHALWDSWYSLGELGYQETEYFISGDARSFATPGITATYKTRIIVRRPASSAAFNGTVLLDWVNVTAQFENAVDTIAAHEMLMREGWAFVHVSAQAAGICCTPLTPKVWDPVRYASLNHPDDDYSFDIFSQIAQAIRTQPGLVGLPAVARILAAGQSQSASRLDTYVRQVQAGAGVVDGFLVHGGGSKVYATAPAVPVLHLLSDAEATPAEPSAWPTYRLWEIAGSAHSDFWTDYHQEVGQGPRTIASAPQQPASADAELHKVAGNYGEQVHPRQLTCIAGGSLFPMRYSVSAALHHLDAWVRTGVAPPAGPRYVFANGSLALDQYGNARGGIRLPPIDVPVATYLSTLCRLGGITVPFTEAQLAVLYPTHAAYFCSMEAKTTASVTVGFMLQPDAEDLLARAAAAKNRWVDPGEPGCA
jgi:hypothetical protein